MSDFFIQATLSNVLVSSGLACLAWLIQKQVPSHAFQKIIWSMVLIKMVTPPIFLLPVVSIPSLTTVETSAAAETQLNEKDAFEAEEVAVIAELEPVSHELPLQSSASPFLTREMVSKGTIYALYTWVLASLILGIVSFYRIIKFHVLLRANTTFDDDLTQRLARLPARKLGLKHCPSIWVTTANLAPFVWWRHGRGVVVLPYRLTEQLSDNELQLVVAHELAHIRRRDHWFRFLEWCTVTSFFWNPVLWWARTQLRRSEEMACDRLVIDAMTCPSHDYVNTLLNVADFLISSPSRPPILASAMDSGGNLEQRLNMAMHCPPKRIGMSLCWTLVVVTLGLFPLGIVTAQDYGAIKRRLGEAVKAGEITEKQAGSMLEALAKTSDKPMSSDKQIAAQKERYQKMAEEIEQAVKNGKLSKEEAKRKLELAREKTLEARKQMLDIPAVGRLFRDGKDKTEVKKTEQPSFEARKKRYEMLEKKLGDAVEKGELTGAEAEKRISEARRQMFGDGKVKTEDKKTEQPSFEARKKRYEMLAEKLEDAVKKGELTEAEAKERMLEARERMFRTPAPKSDSTETKKDLEEAQKKRELRERFRQAEERIRIGIEKELISEEEGKKRLEELRVQLFGEKK